MSQKYNLISRRAAIDALEQIFDRCEEIEAHLPEGDPDRTGYKMYPDYMTVWKYLHQLPSAQPEQQWIPCSESLPEDYVDVLAWFEYYRYGRYECLYQTYGIGTYSKQFNSWMINHETGWRDLRVIAWMPLPKPYKEKDGKNEQV